MRRLVVLFVGITLLSCVLGIILLAADGNPAPDILQNIASGALAGLIGLLVPSDVEEPDERRVGAHRAPTDENVNE